MIDEIVWITQPRPAKPVPTFMCFPCVTTLLVDLMSTHMHYISVFIKLVLQQCSFIDSSFISSHAAHLGDSCIILKCLKILTCTWLRTYRKRALTGASSGPCLVPRGRQRTTSRIWVSGVPVKWRNQIHCVTAPSCGERTWRGLRSVHQLHSERAAPPQAHLIQSNEKTHGLLFDVQVRESTRRESEE